ncbi:YigZ family protein [Methanolobus sp. ZRKC5]|uniref:IMPACT family protein n=1 Tax=unclassified Methanolobus TaxID=2629569 RepID=UPI00313F26E0
MPSHRTLKENGHSQQDFKNSTFIAYAVPVKDECEAKDFINLIKNKHSDANHNVSAYLINSDNVLAMKYDDDGEPAGSSGKPVFKVLEMKELSNVAVVVSRYFGGVKLGFGGLARAYRETAIEAIESAGIIEVHETTSIHIDSYYSDIDTITKLMPEYGTIKKTDYSDVVQFTLEVYSEFKDEFIEKVIDVTKNRVTIK